MSCARCGCMAVALQKSTKPPSSMRGNANSGDEAFCILPADRFA